MLAGLSGKFGERIKNRLEALLPLKLLVHARIAGLIFFSLEDYNLVIHILMRM